MDFDAPETVEDAAEAPKAKEPSAAWRGGFRWRRGLGVADELGPSLVAGGEPRLGGEGRRERVASWMLGGASPAGGVSSWAMHRHEVMGLNLGDLRGPIAGRSDLNLSGHSSCSEKRLTFDKTEPKEFAAVLQSYRKKLEDIYQQHNPERH